jgi:tetratricopeptide (TPR) repeat protein
MRRCVACLTLPLALAISVRIHSAGNVLLAAPKPVATRIRYLNSQPGVAYVGSKACAQCHKDIFDSYLPTNMARALSLPGPLLQSGKLSLPITVFDDKLNRYFQVFAKDSDLYQAVYRYDKDGKTEYRETEKVSYVIGTGRNGMGFLVQRGNYLFQAPLAYFPADQTWALSPGYESRDYGFTRPITAECVTCHSGIPRPVMANVGLYADPPFGELGIGCENCHGPGQLHVAQRQKGLPLRGTDLTIVNPARLSPHLANDVCIFCHEAGDARVLKAGKTFLDFRPGTALEDTVAVIDSTSSHSVGPAVPLVGYYFQLQLARCYRESGDRLKCITCHDPHVQPAPSESAAYYRRKCLQCHTDQSCRQPLASRLHASPSDDCVSCHMTTRPAVRFTHTVVTDHRIVARADEPYPAFSSALPEETSNGLMLVNRGPEQSTGPISPMVLLQAYGQLLTSHPDDAGYQQRYKKLMDELARTDPDDPDVLRSLAAAELQKGTPEGLEHGISYLQRALTLAPKSPNDRLWLAQVLLRAGRKPEAANELQKAIAIAPYTPEYYRYLAVTYITDGKYDDGMKVIHRALQLFPEREDIHDLQERAKELESSSAVPAQ